MNIVMQFPPALETMHHGKRLRSRHFSSSAAELFSFFTSSTIRQEKKKEIKHSKVWPCGLLSRPKKKRPGRQATTHQQLGGIKI
jgi:hypothetical protein